MHLVLVGTSHHRAPLELREQLYVTAPENPELVRRLAGEEGEAVALSTCNRTELYVVDDDPEVAQERAFAELAALSGLAESEIAPSLYTLADEAAAMHLFRVAASLDFPPAGGDLGAADLGIFDPSEGPQGPLDAAELAEGGGEAVLPGVGPEPLEHQRGADGPRAD